MMHSDMSGDPTVTGSQVRLPDGYRLVRTLGGDAWSSTHLAHDVRLDRPVVVEMLARGADQRRRERFLSEIGQVASPGHPHILRVHTAGELDGSAYAVTDHLDAPDLADHLAAVGPLPPATALQILGPIADALDAAHRVGVVHRGLGPRAVLLGPVPVLRGFGVTPEGGITGDERFAPEQATVGPVDARTDVYALGALLRHCVNGMPPGLGDVVARSMARDPGLRFGTCRQVIDAAAAAGAGPFPAPTSVATVAPPRRRRRGLVVLAAIVAVVALLAGAGIVFGPRILAGLRPTSEDLARVPAALSGACDTSNAEGGPPAAPRLLSCSDGAGQDVLVGLYDTPAPAEAAYRELLAAAPGVRGGVGDCADAPGFEQRYPSTGAATGRLFCVGGATARTVWLDVAARSVSVATRPDGNSLDLYRSWAGWVALPAFPTADEQKLTDVLVETGCRRAPAGPLDTLDGLVAAVTCAPKSTGADSVTYYQFGEAEALRRAFQSDVTAAGSPAAVYCGDASKGAAAGNTAYERGPITVGRVLCAATDGTARITWTVDALLVLGRATNGELPALKTYWQANPSPALPRVVSAVNARLAPPFPSAAEATLLGRVPAAKRPFCTRAGAKPTENLGMGRATAVISCSGSGDVIGVYYAQFADAAGLAAVEPGATNGPDCRTQPAGFRGISRYTRPGSTGVLECAVVTAGPYLLWTTDGANVVAYAYGPTAAGLVSMWQSGVAGPN